MFELIFLKILLQISIFLLQTVPKCHTSIQYTVKNLVKMIFKPPSPKNSLFPIRPNPKKFKICNGDIYVIWLTLLCETMTDYSSGPNCRVVPYKHVGRTILPKSITMWSWTIMWGGNFLCLLILAPFKSSTQNGFCIVSLAIKYCFFIFMQIHIAQNKWVLKIF